LVDRPAEALPHVEKALELSRKYSETDINTLANVLRMADIHLLLGHLDRARSLYEKIVALDAQEPAPDRESGFPKPTFPLVGTFIAFPFSTNPDLSWSFNLHQRLFERRASALGAAHPFFPINIDMMAALLERTGRQTDAKQRYEEALEFRRKVLGVTHRHTLASLDKLAEVSLGLNQLEEARQRREEALRLRTASLGEKHPDTLRNLGDLADLLLNRLDRPAEALPLLEKAYRYLAETSDWMTDYRFSQLTEAYKRLGRFADAVPLLEDAVTRALAAEKWRDSEPQYLPVLHDLVKFYYALGRYDQALSVLKRVLNQRLQSLGEKHLITLYSLGDLAEAYLEAGRPKESLPLLERLTEVLIDLLADPVSSIYQAKKGRLDPHFPTEAHRLYSLLLTHRGNLAACYLLLDRPGDARPLIEESLQACKPGRRDCFGVPRDPIILDTLRYWAVASFHQKRPDRSVLLLEHFVNSAEALRSHKDLTREERRELFSKWVPAYKLLSWLFAQQNRPTDAFRTAELAKARTLLESAATQQAIERGMLSSADRAQMKALETKLQTLDNAIGQRREESGELSFLIERHDVAQKLEALKQELTARHPRYGQLSDVDIIEAKAGQTLLSSETAVISYLFQPAKQGDILVVFVLTGEGLTAKTLTVPHLEETLRVYRGLLGQRQSPTKLTLDDAWKPIWPVWRMTDGSYTAAKDPPEGAHPGRGLEDISHYLAEQLLVPVLDSLQGKRHWIIAPDGPLLSLPFETLQLGEQLVVAQHDLSLSYRSIK
jgi:tetratricopeptide (TPR) repeat protein